MLDAAAETFDSEQCCDEGRERELTATPQAELALA